MGIPSITEVHSYPDIETLYVDGFNSILEEWDETGPGPWLDDNTGNEVYTSINNEEHLEFTYANHAGSETINSVTFYIELKGPSARKDQVECLIQIQGGGVWLEVLSQDPDADDYAWYSADLSGYANTWAKINYAKLKIRYKRTGSPSTQTLYARRSYLEIDYVESPQPPPGNGGPPPNPGYGEDSPSLGQFVDDYENEDYVSIKNYTVRNSTLNSMELNVTGEYQTMVYSPLQLREHKSYSAYNPIITFSGPTTYVAMSSTGPSLGKGYFFFVVDREWIDGKYFRWRWKHTGYSSATAQLLDGEYDRSSMTDFPNGAGMIFKGNGLLQTLDTCPFPVLKTSDVLVDASGGILEKATIFIILSDGWSAQSLITYLYWFQINEGSGGADNIMGWNMATEGTTRTMEQTGTYSDHGRVYDGDIDDYEEGGYYVSGYFTTTELLSGLNGSSLVLMTNSTLNSGDLRVQFSIDNSTWVNHNNDTGHDTLTGGFEALDLRDLNFTTLYLRYNFTRGGSELTPRLFQTRIISTEDGGAGPPGDGVEAVSVAPYLAIGLVLAMSMILLADKARR